MTSNNPFNFCDNRSKIGGFLSLKIAESKNIIQQHSMNIIEMPLAVFLFREEWLAEFGILNKTLADLKLELQITPNGHLQTPSLKFVTEQDISPQDFHSWFQQYIQGRNLVVQLLNNNNLVRTLNPLGMTYNYIGSAEFGQANKYELIFTRAKMIDSVFNPIKDIEQKAPVYSEPTMNVKKTNVEIVFNDFVDPSLYETKFGATNNPRKSKPFNRISNLLDGTYYIFIILKSNPEYFLTYKIIADANSESVITLV